MVELTRAIPVLGMADATVTERFYVERLGFQLVSSFFPDPLSRCPAHLVLTRDAAALHLSSFGSPAPAAAYVELTDVDAFFAELGSKGVLCHLAPTDQTWGRRELALRDPFGNVLTFGARIDAERIRAAEERERR